MKRTKTELITGGILLLLFIVFTVTLNFVDIRAVGPLGSTVAYGGINAAFHHFSGVHWWLYEITEWMGNFAAVFALFGAVVSVLQWIRRKSLKRVDYPLLILMAFYVLLFGVYFLFEAVTINYRPVIVDGALAGSYPSSTTMVTFFVLMSAVIPFDRLVRSERTKKNLKIFCIVYASFTVIGRLFCGVHWLTDIFGGFLYALSLLLLYSGTIHYAEEKGARIIRIKRQRRASLHKNT